VLSGNPIPLTLTLSHEERGQAAADSTIREVRRPDTALSFAEQQRRILPLSALPFPSLLTPLPSDGRGEAKGERRVEGKREARGANHTGIAFVVRSSTEVSRKS